MGKGTGPLADERPKVGQMARYKRGGVGDTRDLHEVVAVSQQGGLVKLKINKATTNWLIASRFTFEDATNG